MKKTWVGAIFLIIAMAYSNCSEFKALNLNSISSNEIPPAIIPQQEPPVVVPPVNTGDPICVAKPDPNFPKFPNDSGGTRLVDWGFDKVEGQGLKDAYPSPDKDARDITTCSDAPISPPNVLKNLRALAGDGSGGNQLDYYQKSFDEVYVGLVWKANPEFEGAYGNRLFIILTDNGIQGFVSWNKLENRTLDEGRVTFSPVAGINVNNCHLTGDPRCVAGSMNLDANIKPNHVVGRNKWHLVEAILKRSTAEGRKDGRIRWWVDGELLGDYIGLDTGGGRIVDVSYQQGWVNRQLVKQTQTTDWYYLVDHIRITDRSQ